MTGTGGLGFWGPHCREPPESTGRGGVLAVPPEALGAMAPLLEGELRYTHEGLGWTQDQLPPGVALAPGKPGHQSPSCSRRHWREQSPSLASEEPLGASPPQMEKLRHGAAAPTQPVDGTCRHPSSSGDPGTPSLFPLRHHRPLPRQSHNTPGPVLWEGGARLGPLNQPTPVTSAAAGAARAEITNGCHCGAQTCDYNYHPLGDLA